MHSLRLAPTKKIPATDFAWNVEIECFDPGNGDENAEEIDQTIRGIIEQRNHTTQTVNRVYANHARAAVFANMGD